MITLMNYTRKFPIVAGRHRKLSCVSVKHNFSQSKWSRTADLTAATNIVLMKSARDVQQVLTFWATVGSGRFHFRIV